MKPTNYSLFINGQSIPAQDSRTFTRDSPAHDTCVGTYALASESDVAAAVTAARAAFETGPWPRESASGRATVLRRTATAIRTHADELARIETLESGKPITQARDEMGWAAGLWDHAANLAETNAGEAHNQLSEQHLGWVVTEPAGVAALITPWNFPLLIISQKLPFALAAGCTCVVKPSEFTSGTTVRLATLLQEAGLPAGVCNVVTGYGEPTGSTLVAHPEVDVVSFTGSTRVGQQIASLAAGSLKKVSLELGGKNPQIVFSDADIEAAADAIVFGLLFNMGECCNSGSRLIVHETVAETLLDRVITLADRVRTGDPLDEQTQLGAIINEAQHQKILGHIEHSKSSGAQLRLGGTALTRPSGRYVAPTIFDRVDPNSALAREEIFGPVLAVMRFSTIDEAVQLANATDYGLSGAVWTRDIDTAMAVSRRIRAGTIWINTFMDGFPQLPFGGFRQSGLGRELGAHALADYQETKTILLHTGPRSPWVAPA
jgi:acyl-CoA reductase-like NAD-dependent aldehyde dehydrogenase